MEARLCPKCGEVLRYERFNYSDADDGADREDQVGEDWWCPKCGWTDYDDDEPEVDDYQTIGDLFIDEDGSEER